MPRKKITGTKTQEPHVSLQARVQTIRTQISDLVELHAKLTGSKARTIKPTQFKDTSFIGVMQETPEHLAYLSTELQTILDSLKISFFSIPKSGS